VDGVIVHEPPLRDDPTVRMPDITRAAAVLGWRPVIDLTVGLQRTIDHFRQRLQV
jgi:UDP-glucuronate decarboxylase